MLEEQIFYDPTVVALNYIHSQRKPVKETELMDDLHTILKNLTNDSVNIEIIENSSPFCPHWNPQISDGLNDLAKLGVIKITEESIDKIRIEVYFGRGNYFKRFLKRVNEEIDPEVKEKITKYIKLANHSK